MREDPDNLPGWDNTHMRIDRMRVTEKDGLWTIMPPDRRKPISLCPCCDQPFTRSRAAKLVANAIYPPSVQESEVPDSVKARALFNRWNRARVQ